jgi:PAS domain S-box-containing protein
MNNFGPPAPDPDADDPRDVSRDTGIRPVIRLEGRELSDFFFNIPATVWTTDERLVLTFAQGTYLNRLQIDPDRLVGRTIQDILLDGREDHPLIQGHLTALDGHENTVRIEWGGRLYSARVAPLRDSDGRVAGCVGLLVEIAWLPDDEGTLRESDIRLRRVLDANPMGVAFANDRGCITDANDAFLHIAGCAREDMMLEEISWPALMPVESHQRQIRALEEIQTTGRCTPFETEIIRPDGTRVPVQVTAVRLSARRREAVAFVLDISERKNTIQRLQAELECADGLAEATSDDDVAALVRNVFVRGLAWQSAAIWRATEATRLGGPPAARAVLTSQEVWMPAQRTLALPLVAEGRCHGVLVLTAGPGMAVEDEPLEACRRIARRLARFLSRTAR